MGARGEWEGGGNKGREGGSDYVKDGASGNG